MATNSVLDRLPGSRGTAPTPRAYPSTTRESTHHAAHRTHLHRQHDRPAALLVLRRVRAGPPRRGHWSPPRHLPRRLRNPPFLPPPPRPRRPLPALLLDRHPHRPRLDRRLL